MVFEERSVLYGEPIHILFHISQGQKLLSSHNHYHTGVITSTPKSLRAMRKLLLQGWEHMEKLVTPTRLVTEEQITRQMNILKSILL